MLDSTRDPISETLITRKQALSFWDHAAQRVAPSRGVMVTCRAVRRNEVVVTPPLDWIRQNPEAAAWCVPTLAERRTLDENMVSTVAGNELPYFTRTPLDSNDTGEKDADNLETYAEAVAEQKIPYDQLHGHVVENGEFGWVVVPDTAALAAPPSYEEDTAAEGDDRPKKQPRSVYDRGNDGKPITRKKDESDKDYAKRRSEVQSKGAYDEAYLAWLAERYPVSVRIVNPLDCAPVVIQSSGADPYEIRGLAIRTLYDADDLLDMGFNWIGADQKDKGASRGKKLPAVKKERLGPALIPRAWGTETCWGEGEQIYLHELYWMTPRGHAIGAFTVGGVGTYFGEPPKDEHGKLDVTGMEDSVAIIDFTEDYGLPPFETLWGYEWGLHTQDDIAYRSRPWLAHFLSDIVNIESLRMALLCDVWEETFTGHYLKPDKDLPSESWLQTRPNTAPQLRVQRRPKSGEVLTYPGEIFPFKAASDRKAAWTYLEYLHNELKQNTPSSEQSGGPSDASGHSLVVQHSLLITSKGQMRRAVLRAAEGILSRMLLICCAVATVGVKGKDGKRQTLPWLPIPVTNEAILPNGDVRDRIEVIQPQERWIGQNYHLKAQYPEEGNLADIEQAMSAAERGFGSDEDVYRAQGKRSTIRERIKIANYQWIMRNPAGQLELQTRAAKIRGDKMRQQILQAVQQGVASPGGTPMAAVGGQGAPPAPGMSGPGPQNGGPTQLSNPAQDSLNGAISGAVGSASASRDAMAQAQIGAA
jgi:hypothetical protein